MKAANATGSAGTTGELSSKLCPNGFGAAEEAAAEEDEDVGEGKRFEAEEDATNDENCVRTVPLPGEKCAVSRWILVSCLDWEEIVEEGENGEKEEDEETALDNIIANAAGEGGGWNVKYDEEEGVKEEGRKGEI